MSPITGRYAIALARVPTTDPGPAAHPAKNVPTGPGLPNPSDDDSRRTPMVGVTPAVLEPVDTDNNDATEHPTEQFSTDHAALVDLLGRYPTSSFAPPENRVAWLLDTARELDRLGWTADAADARDRAVRIVRAVMSKVAGSDRR